MMHNTVRICIAIALLGLSACSDKAAMDEAAVAAPVIVVEPVILESKSDCAPSDMGDGIGGTGCPVID